MRDARHLLLGLAIGVTTSVGVAVARTCVAVDYAYGAYIFYGHRDGFGCPDGTTTPPDTGAWLGPAAGWEGTVHAEVRGDEESFSSDVRTIRGPGTTLFVVERR